MISIYELPLWLYDKSYSCITSRYCLRVMLMLTLLLAAQPLLFSVYAQSRNQAPQSTFVITLRGRVVDARTGEPISKVKIIVGESGQSTTTDERGAFTIENLPPGEVEMYITTVNYGLTKKTILVKDAENAQIEIALNQEAATLSEQVTVTARPFEETETNSASEQSLNKSELQKLSTVLLGDPLRAAQALPSVIANDDFRSEFAVRGAGFGRVGIYLDGVLTDNFVHTLQGNPLDTGSISVINADTLSTVSLLSGAYPARYGDSTAAVLNLETRDGNRVKPTGRIAASLSNTSGVVDGPFAGGRGSYLFAARKSYLGYLVRRVNDANDNRDNPSIIEFADAHGKAVYDLSARQQFGISAIFGSFGFDRNRPREQLGLNRTLNADSRNFLVDAHYNYTPNSRLFTQTRVFGLRTSFTNMNPDGRILEDGLRTQAGIRSDINFLVRPSHRIEAGLYVRSLRGERLSERFQTSSGAVVTARNLESFARRATEQSYYAQDTYTNERLGLSLTGGGRIEHSGLTDETVFSPVRRFNLHSAISGGYAQASAGTTSSRTSSISSVSLAIQVYAPNEPHITT